MTRIALSSALAAAVLTVMSVVALVAHADDAQVERGKYLVNLGGCMDCHPPVTSLASQTWRATSAAGTSDF